MRPIRFCCCIPGPKKGHRQLAHYIPIMMLLNEFGMVNADFLSKTLGLSRDNAKQILKRLKDYGFIEPIIPGYYRVVAFETKMRVNKRTLPELEMEIEEFHRVQEKKVSEARLREKHMESMTMNEKFAAGLWGLDPWRDHRMPLDEAE